MLFVSLGIIVKRPFFDPLRDEALYDDGEFWEVSVCLKTVIIWTFPNVETLSFPITRIADLAQAI